MNTNTALILSLLVIPASGCTMDFGNRYGTNGGSDTSDIYNGVVIEVYSARTGNLLDYIAIDSYEFTSEPYEITVIDPDPYYDPSQLYVYTWQKFHYVNLQYCSTATCSA